MCRHLAGTLLMFSMLTAPALVTAENIDEGQFRLGLLRPLSVKSSDQSAEKAAAIAEFALQRIAEIQGIPFRL